MAKTLEEWLPVVMEFNPMAQLPENWVQAWLHAGSAVIDHWGAPAGNAALRAEIQQYFTSCAMCADSLKHCMGNVVWLGPADLSPQKICQALQQDKPVVMQVQQNAGTDHWFMIQPRDKQVHIVDAWQGKHHVRISSTHGKQDVQKLLTDLVSENAELRNLAAKSLFGADHGFVLNSARGIRLKCCSVGEAGKGLEVAAKSQRAASMDGLVLKGKNFEMQIDRAKSMDDALPRGAQPFKQEAGNGGNVGDGLPRGAEPRKATNVGAEIAIGAVVGGSFGFILSLWSVLAAPNGRTAGQKAEDVVVPTLVGAGEGAGAMAVLRAMENSSAGLKFLGGAGVAVGGTALMIGWDAIKMARGRATVIELRKNSAASLGAGGGGLAGAAAGAALGTACGGPVGSVIGGLIGGLAAGFGGAKGGELLDKTIWDEAEDVKEHAFRFLNYGYKRGAKPAPTCPRELQQRYDQRVKENPEDDEWRLQCQQNLRVVMSELWPQIHQLETLVAEEMKKVGQDK